MSIKLDNGFNLRIDRMYVNGCYEGQIIGWPDKETQEEYICSSDVALQSVLGNYPTYVIRPKIFYDEVQGVDRMPWWRIGVYLEGPEIACKSQGVGSHLIVVFFSDDPFGKKLMDEIVEEAIHELDWEMIAENFDL